MKQCDESILDTLIAVYGGYRIQTIEVFDRPNWDRHEYPGALMLSCPRCSEIGASAWVDDSGALSVHCRETCRANSAITAIAEKRIAKLPASASDAVSAEVAEHGRIAGIIEILGEARARLDCADAVSAFEDAAYECYPECCEVCAEEREHTLAAAGLLYTLVGMYRDDKAAHSEAALWSEARAMTAEDAEHISRRIQRWADTDTEAGAIERFERALSRAEWMRGR